MNSLSFLQSIDHLPTISRQSFANVWNGRSVLIVGIALFALGCLAAACYHVYRSYLKAKKIAPWNAEYKQTLKDFAVQKLLKKEDQDALISQLENEEAQMRLRQDPRSSLARLEKAMLLEKKNRVVPYNLIAKYAMQAGPFLTKLDLQDLGSFITDRDLAGICQSCPNLEELHLGPFTQLKGTFIAKLPHKLKHLHFNQCDWLTDEHIAQLPPTLEVLALSRCKNVKFSQAFPSGLHSLSVEGGFLNHENFGFLLPCSRLKSLDFKYLDASGMTNLPGQLESLSLFGCLIADEYIGRLPPQLKSLDLSHCHVSDADMGKLPPHLKSLNVSFCMSLSNAAFAALPSTLTSLVLRWCHQLTDQALVPLAAHAKLESLDIGCCDNFTDAALVKLPPHLKSLGLSLCRQLTDAALVPLAAHATLESLDLAYCSGFTDAALSSLPPNVKRVALEGCNQFTEQAIHQVELKGVKVKTKIDFL